MDNRCIGVFDSGLGGLTCVKEIMNILPEENIVFFGDTGRVPYGTRSAQTIIKYTQSDIRFLMEFNPKLIVIACGTASSTSLETVIPQFDVPIIGVVSPSSHAAAKATKNGKIGVIGTNLSINSGKYQQEIKKINPSFQVYSKACPLFVPLVENGYINSPITLMAAEEYLKPLCDEGVDTLILGCTHYPLIKETIRKVMGENVVLIDSGKETADSIKDLIDNGEISFAEEKTQDKFFISDKVQSFKEMAEMFLEKEIKGSVEKIDIEKYMV